MQKNNNFDDSLVYDLNDEIEEITETLTVTDNKISLTQIPDSFSKVKITGYKETIKTTPNSGFFNVNYSNGIVTFGGTIENGTSVSVHYYGKGRILNFASKILDGSISVDKLNFEIPTKAEFDTSVHHTKGKINIYEYQHLVTNNDWTSAINQAMQDITSGGTIKFPEGTFNHTGITIPARYINFEGSGRYGTFLKNTSTNDAVTFSNNAERGSFRNMAVMGNGTLTYGTDATSGHAFVFSNNSVSWNFENITVRGHGGNGFHGGSNGHVNNINIINSEIEFNKGTGVHFVAKAGSYQINIINVTGCNVAKNGGSGFELWGNNINIKRNSVQGNRKYAYDINSDLVEGTGSVSCDTINIKGNYEELNLLGTLNVKVDKIASPVTYKYIKELHFEENFGYEEGLDASVTSLITITKGSGLANVLIDRAIRAFSYKKNSLTPSAGVNILNANNMLDSSSEIYLSNFNQDTSKFVNLGYAKLIRKNKTYVLNNFLLAKGVNFTDITTGKSSNITTATSIYYPINIENYNGIYQVGIPIDTDYPTPRIDFNFYGRPKANKGAYTLLHGLITTTINNGVAERLTDSVNLFGDNLDIYLEVKVYPGSGGTYLYVYNPYFTFD